MADFVDDNGNSCFIDDLSVIAWVDDIGNSLSCIDGPVPAPAPVKGNRGKGKKQQIYTQGPWAYR
jgi:hypothetical protein